MSKKESDKRKHQDELDTALAFEEFIETFQTPSNAAVSKVWVKSGTYETNSKYKEDATKSLYQPASRFLQKRNDKFAIKQAQECARILPTQKPDHNKKKKISNLDLIKEELKLIHSSKSTVSKKTGEDCVQNPGILYDLYDVNKSTNLHVNNLHPSTTEVQLKSLFGKFGALASVKIMWPRSEEEKTRDKLTGFVAFMSRNDAKRAMNYLHGRKIMNYEIRIGWSKSVPIPAFPIYIPPVLLEYFQPPPFTGLPFNAQPPENLPLVPPLSFEEYLSHCVVKVTIPMNKNTQANIHRMIEFVVREGPLFEQIIMSREFNNPNFQFLFDNRSPEHIYYRWKLYSILQGDSLSDWRLQEFRMFEGGSIWRPPINYDYSEGMPEHLIETVLPEIQKSLFAPNRDYLEKLIHNLTPERTQIRETTIFCCNNIDAAEEIAQCLTQSLRTQCLKKIVARLYLISDLLYNTRNKSVVFKRTIEIDLKPTLEHIAQIYELSDINQKQIFLTRIQRIFNAWIYWNFFKPDELHVLLKLFIKENPVEELQQQYIEKPSEVSEIEQAPLPELIPLPEPLHEPTHEEPKPSETLPGFKPSRWETIDPEVVESQAMTTSKWSDMMRGDLKAEKLEDHRRAQLKNLSSEKRKKLREIELKVMEYQDMLESNSSRRDRRYDQKKVTALVEEYRKKQIDRFLDKLASEKRSDDTRRSDRYRKYKNH